MIDLKLSGKNRSILLLDVFSDANDIEPGEWSRFNLVTNTEKGRLEIALYREPNENEEYAEMLTLHIFLGDNVIFCGTVNEEKGE